MKAKNLNNLNNLNKKNKLWKMLGVSVGISLLAGCAEVLTPSQSVGQLKANPSSQYVPAQNSAQVKTQIITQYVPVPVPGQLMLTPETPNIVGNSASQPKFLTKDAAVAYAQKHAMVEPNSSDFFNAMTTYHYMPSAMYVIYTAPMNITDIVFAPGEKIISDAAGDTLRWQVSQTYSGEGDQIQQHILVKPSSSGLTNTMLVTTNPHVYHLLLKSTDNDTFMMSVQWNYPQDMVHFDQASQPGAAPSSSALGESSSQPYQLNLAHLKFNYAFGLSQGEKPSWYPTRIFSDGHQTFIQFPESAANSNALPVLFVANTQGAYGTMVNWHMHWPYLIVDGVIHEAQLRSGVKSQKDQVIVQIEQTDK